MGRRAARLFSEEALLVSSISIHGLISLKDKQMLFFKSSYKTLNWGTLKLFLFKIRNDGQES